MSWRSWRFGFRREISEDLLRKNKNHILKTGDVIKHGLSKNLIGDIKSITDFVYVQWRGPAHSSAGMHRYTPEYIIRYMELMESKKDGHHLTEIFK